MMSDFPELDAAMRSVDAYYKDRGIFQDRFGFGQKAAIVVVDFAYGWTDDKYAGGSRRLDEPVRKTAELLEFVRSRHLPVPIIYTTSPYHPETGDQPFKSAADLVEGDRFRPWDSRACVIDERVTPTPKDLVILKENASAFFGTHLAGYLIENRCDTLLITGCSTSACIRATATDAKSYRFKPLIIRDCVGDRAQAAHDWTLFDIQARFADVVSLNNVLSHLERLGHA
ncbi:MAG: isochorismatase family protein [Planctomycetales bacterium]